MPTTTVNPNANGTDYTGWSRVGGTSNWQALTTDDGDTSRHQSDTANADASFQVEAIPLAAAVITRVEVFDKLYWAGQAHNGAAFMRLPAVGAVVGNTWSVTGTPYDMYSWDFISNRPGGGSWTPEDLIGGANGAQPGCRCTTSTGTGTLRWTYMYMEIDWLGAGGFALFVSQWLPPLLAVASHGLSKLDMAKILRNLKTRPSSDEDFARLLNAFKVRPVYGRI